MDEKYARMVGQKIERVAQLSVDEMAELGWQYADRPVTVIFFESGSWLLPLADAEGNGFGAFYYLEVKND